MGEWISLICVAADGQRGHRPVGHGLEPAAQTVYIRCSGSHRGGHHSGHLAGADAGALGGWMFGGSDGEKSRGRAAHCHGRVDDDRCPAGGTTQNNACAGGMGGVSGALPDFGRKQHGAGHRRRLGWQQRLGGSFVQLRHHRSGDLPRRCAGTLRPAGVAVPVWSDALRRCLSAVGGGGAVDLKTT